MNNKKSKLTFTSGNAKLGKHIATFSLPAGHSCPSALHCLSKANRETGKVKDGKETKFRCFAASQEALYPSVRRARWHNLSLLRNLSKTKMVSLIHASLPKQEIVRVHVAGDFFSQAYFDAWLAVTKKNSSKLFYAYTKSIPYWLARLDDIPSNFKLTASLGGRHDNLIAERNLKSVRVVFSEREAEALSLALDHDDTHAYLFDESFALLIHGIQPKGTEASRALETLKRRGNYGYGTAAQSRTTYVHDDRKTRRIALHVA